MKLKDVEKVLYFESFMVVEPGLTKLKKNQLLSEEEYVKAQEEYGEEAFTEKDYKRIRKGISQRLLSTNNEPYPTIPAQFLRVDEIRVQEKDDKERLKKVEIINEHLEKMSKDHEKYL